MTEILLGVIAGVLLIVMLIGLALVMAMIALCRTMANLENDISCIWLEMSEMDLKEPEAKEKPPDAEGQADTEHRQSRAPMVRKAAERLERRRKEGLNGLD